MKKLNILSIFVVITLFGCQPKKSELKIGSLKVDFMESPIGLDNKTPQLSWQLESEKPNTKQTAYEIFVSTDRDKLANGQGDLWVSGKVNSDQSVNIPYKGGALKSGQRCYWQVKVWDNQSTSPAISGVNTWEMGLLSNSDWKGQWISQVSSSDSVPPLLPAPYFRKDITLKSEVKSARIYTTGLGYFELSLNGEKVSDHELDPMVTQYDQRVKYLTFDVTNQMQSGTNTVGMILGNGWYNLHTRSAWDFDQANWRDSPKMILQMIVEYVDGTTELFTSDNTWKTSAGPILFDGIRNGEFYDNRMSLGDWNKPGYDDSDWEQAKVVNGPEGILSSQVMPPIRVTQKLKPKSVVKIGDKHVIDFGQNMAGRIQLEVNGNSGDSIVMKYGERINDKGLLDQQELQRFIWTGNAQTDVYISNGDKYETYSPGFMYHGFQYVEIEGYRGELTSDKIIAEMMHTDLKNAGTFSCSNTLFNQLHEAGKWAFLSNYHGYPTDCPHREKIGWTGDAQLSAEMGLYNFDLYNSYKKWLDDFIDQQRPNGQISGIVPTAGWGFTFGRDSEDPAFEHGCGPQWEAAFITLPYQLYLHYGDPSILEKYYPYLQQYLDYLEKTSEGNLLSIGIDDHKPVKVVTEGPILSSGFYYYVAKTLSDIAGILNKSNDSITYKSLASNIKSSFLDKYYDPSTGQVGNGGQTSLSMALHFGLVDLESKSQVTENLLKHIEGENYHFDAGVLGVKFLTNVLMNEGHSDYLYQMLNQRDYPSFGNWIEMGANTLWQEWDGSRSRNHIMFGSFLEFFYEGLAGINIDPNEPGYKHFYISPTFNKEIDWVEASHLSPYGLITSNWKKEGDQYTMKIEIPSNSEATIKLPEAIQNSKISTNSTDSEDFQSNTRLGSGKYTISWTN